ncbi:MAG TPA: hypothetical protein VLD37_05190 [Candidatus Bilamarchaeum sp.]|nr:hypothetical protein [Candidatus Bilamarchaeum sp.]
MRREALILLALLAVSCAALDQSYIQSVSRDGTSTISKTSELTLFTTVLTNKSFASMKQACESGKNLDCIVDVKAKTVTITESFSPGGYYTYSSEYGIPEVAYTLTINKIPNDKFASSLSKLLIAANISGAAEGAGSVNPIDFEDEANNREAAGILRQIRANLTYTIVMPFDVDEAHAGNITGTVSGKTVTFDLVSLLQESKPIVVRSRELNLGYIVLFIGLIAVAALAFSFFWSKPMKKKKG